MSEVTGYCGHCHLPHHAGSDHYLRPCETFREHTAMLEKEQEETTLIIERQEKTIRTQAKMLEAARQERDCALSDTSVKHKYRADVLEAQLEAARERFAEQNATLEQARQRNSALLLRVKELEDASKARPPLPASRVKDWAEEKANELMSVAVAWAIDMGPNNLYAAIYNALREALDAAGFTPVRDNCQFGNLGKQEQNEPARQEEKEKRE